MQYHNNTRLIFCRNFRVLHHGASKLQQEPSRQSANFRFYFSYKYLPILFPDPALIPETFVMGKSRVCGYICIVGCKAWWDRVKLWLMSLPDVLLLRLKLARLEQFRYSFKNSVVCTILISLFWRFHFNTAPRKKAKFICCGSSLTEKIKRTEQKHTVFSVEEWNMESHYEFWVPGDFPFQRYLSDNLSSN